jgi:hypothetical protein
VLLIVPPSLSLCCHQPICIICGAHAEDTRNFLFSFVFGMLTYAQRRDAWDMAAEICLSQLPSLIEDPNAEFLVCSLGFVLV